MTLHQVITRNLAIYKGLEELLAILCFKITGSNLEGTPRVNSRNQIQGRIQGGVVGQTLPSDHQKSN